jgi:hypothetical protein
MEGLYILQEDMNEYEVMEIPTNSTKFEKEICYKDSLCCTFDIELDFQIAENGMVRNLQ